MLFVGTSIIHPSTEGVFLLCNILDLLIYSSLFCFSLSRSKFLLIYGFPENCHPNSSVCFYFKSFTLFWVWNIFICFCQFFTFSAPMATFRKFACRHGLRIADRRKKESRWHTTDTAATKRAFQMITDQSISLLRFRPSHLFRRISVQTDTQ